MKLLVIEDDVKIAAAVKRGLQAEGFTVDVASDGDEGLWRATEGGYDLVVLDIMLPGRNGYVVCRELRRAGKTVPILMLTAKAGDLDEAEGLDTGADDFLSKPFSFPVLVARVRALLRRAGGSPRVDLCLGDLRVDPAARRLWRGEAEISLTTREFDVLEFLLRRRGMVLSKLDILNGVWSDDFDGDPNIVEVYVARLRRKLTEGADTSADSSGASPDISADAARIVTVRGAGYRLGCS